MVVGTFAFAVMIVLVRKTSVKFNAFEITFWRAAFGLVFMAPWLMRARFSGLRTSRGHIHLCRNLLHFVGIVLWYFAVARINLTEGMALQFTVPLFTIALAMLVLGERVDSRRWIATLVGFCGVLIILRPGAIPITIVPLAVLVASVFYAGSNILTKVLSRNDPADAIVFYMNLAHVPLALAGALVIGWTVPAGTDLIWLAGVALSATIAHYCLARAFREADASQVIAIDFLKLPWVTLLALMMFGEIPSVWGWLGGAVIFFSAYYIVRRDARLARAAEAGAS